MKGLFLDGNTITQAVRAQELTKISLDDLKEYVNKLVDRSKWCLALNGDYFDWNVTFK